MPADHNTAILRLETLSQLADGQAAATINAAIAAAVRDTEDRGTDEKPRKVIIEIELRKIGDDAIACAVKAKTTVPPYLTKPTVGRIQTDGRATAMTFNPHNADNPDQKTIDFQGE